MERSERPPVWKMVREAVEELGGRTTNVAVRDWILRRYPGTNPSTIQCGIIFCTVNHASRIHYAYNAKPRISNTEYDFLFRTDRGQIELYDPAKHGQWEISRAEDGRLAVGPVGGEQMAGEEAGQQPEELEQARAPAGFAAEAHLRDFLAQHIEEVEPGLQLFVDEDGNDGVEYPTPVGRIDILALDRDGRFVVIELKVSHGPDSAAGQVLRYKNWVKKHLAGDAPVRGIVIAQHISDKILYAIAADPHVSTKEYEVSLTFRDKPGVELSEKA